MSLYLQAAMTVALSLAVALLVMPAAYHLGERYELGVLRHHRGRGRRTVSFLGGGAVVIATGASFLISAGTPRRSVALLAGAAALFLVGFVGDLSSGGRLYSGFRFIAQVGIAVATWWWGFRETFDGPVEASLLVVLLVGTASAFNRLDSADGVAGPSAVGTALGVSAVAVLAGLSEPAPLSLAVFGACVGFVANNLRGWVCLGRGGALFAGFILGGSALIAAEPFGPGWILVAIVTMLSILVADAWVVSLSRFLHGRLLFRAASDRISDHLVAARVTTLTVVAIHAAVALVGGASVALASATRPEVMLVFLGLVAAEGLILQFVEIYPDAPGSWRRRLTAAVAVVAFGGMLLPLGPALAAASHLQAARNRLADAVVASRDLQIDEARRLFGEASFYSRSALVELKSPLTKPARIVPLIRNEFRNVQAMAEGALIVSDAAQDGLRVGELLVATDGSSPVLSKGRFDPEFVSAIRPHTASARVQLRRASDVVSGEPPALIPQLARAKARFISEVGMARSMVEKVEASADLLPHLFGTDYPRRWLLLIQNPVELRATGGFLGAFGIIKGEAGTLTLERLESNLGLPAPKGPAAAPADYRARYDRFDARVTWQNVNMTPDFPTAAKTMISMWQRATGEELDGVIAMDAVALADLLRVVGPVQVPDLGEVNPDNFVPLALNQAYVRYPDKRDRVDVLLRVGREVWTKLLSSDFSDPRAVAEPIANAVARRSIQLWVPEQERLVNTVGADGRTGPAEQSDYLMVVGQNAAANKVDYYARREVGYSVDLDPRGNATADVEVRLRNETPNGGLPSSVVGPYLQSDAPGLNRTFLSIYTSPAMGLSKASVDGEPVGLESETELGLAVTSRFMEMPAQSSSLLTASLEGPAPDRGHYRLKVQRQASLHPDSFRLEVTIPNGMVISEVSEGIVTKGRKAFWSGELRSDMDFWVKYGNSLNDRVRGYLKG